MFQQPLLPEHSARAMGLTEAFLPAVQAAWCCQSAPTGTELAACSKAPVTNYSTASLPRHDLSHVPRCAAVQQVRGKEKGTLVYPAGLGNDLRVAGALARFSMPASAEDTSRQSLSGPKAAGSLCPARRTELWSPLQAGEASGLVVWCLS